LTDYFYTADRHTGDDRYSYLNNEIVDLWKQQPGSDLTKALTRVREQNSITDDQWSQQYACLRNNFYVGMADFRKSAKCQVTNYMLLAASAIIMATILVKCTPSLTSSTCSPLIIIRSLGGSPARRQAQP
jgi:chitin synthase